MKKKLALLAVGIVLGLVAAHQRGSSAPTAERAVRFADAEKNLEDASRLLQTRLLPLVERMPKEADRVRALLRSNDELLQQLRATTGAR